MKQKSEKQKDKQEWDKLTPEEQVKIKECVMEWRKQALSAFKKMSEDIEARPAPCDGSDYEVKAVVIWWLRKNKDIQSIPLAAICNAFNISVTYYNQLKAIHQYDWAEWFKDGDKHNQDGIKNIGIST